MTTDIVKKTVSITRLKSGYAVEVETEDKQGMVHGTHVERTNHAFTTFREALFLLTVEFKGLDPQAEEIHAKLAREDAP